jgi:hypothetical protein
MMIQTPQPNTGLAPLVGVMPRHRGARDMGIYRFRILDNGNRVIAGQYSHCKDDDAARELADILAAQVKGLSVDIWSDQQREVPRKCLRLLTPADESGPKRDPSGWRPYRPYQRKDTA